MNKNEYESLKEKLRLTQVDNNLLMTENARYRELLDFFLNEYKSDTESLIKLAREALKGE